MPSQQPCSGWCFNGLRQSVVEGTTKSDKAWVTLTWLAEHTQRRRGCCKSCGSVVCSSSHIATIKTQKQVAETSTFNATVTMQVVHMIAVACLLLASASSPHPSCAEQAHETIVSPNGEAVAAVYTLPRGKEASDMLTDLQQRGWTVLRQAVPVSSIAQYRSASAAAAAASEHDSVQADTK